MGHEEPPQEGQSVEKQEVEIKTPEQVSADIKELAENEKNELVEHTNEKKGTGHLGVKNEQGEYLAEANYKLKDPEDPSKGYDYYYEKSYEVDENDRRTAEKGSDLLSEKGGNAWEKSITPGERGPVIEKGKITQGPDKGHAWEKQYEYLHSELADIDVTVEAGKITEQGDNKKKEPAGHSWVHVRK